MPRYAVVDLKKEQAHFQTSLQVVIDALVNDLMALAYCSLH
jgi:hypothetical protein